ncbi:antitermination protein [Providencia rettgeri]|uniref:antitermination protein n=1 Tax=Providencia rettgeri TaxID=587 RepID=UPI0025742374|nr:antitermination protein [Providencia rettgeri]MDL9985196.1 antitermination protein [Providencia rettgeri]
MRLEDLPKYFSPKSPMFSDSPAATASDNLTITDVMASLGLATSKARMGIELFLAKHGINKPDEAVESLYQYALTQAHKYSAIQKLDEDDRSSVLQILANYAFQDYARSAASKKACPDCDGGFIEAEVFTTKQYTRWVDRNVIKETKRMGFEIKAGEYANFREVRETKRIVCKTCNGKGEVSHSCRCNGRGEVMDKKETEKQGIPVYKTCCKCSGLGYSRLKFNEVFIKLQTVIDIPKTTCYDNFKPIFEFLVEDCFKEEAHAEQMLHMVTKREPISIN